MESSTNFTVEDANNIHEAVLADQARQLKKYYLCDVEIEHLFPPPARMNRGYLNFILRCKCGYSPTVHVTTQFPAGRVYYKCGSTDTRNQCEFLFTSHSSNILCSISAAAVNLLNYVSTKKIIGNICVVHTTLYLKGVF